MRRPMIAWFGTARRPAHSIVAPPGARLCSRRSGAILVWFALLLALLLGMVGLVVDAGLLMAAHRQAQNAADAAALAAALDLLYGRGETTARATAVTFVKSHNGLPDAPDPVVNIPPASGPYAGAAGFVEVIATHPRSTYFIQILGVAQNQTVRARAVAGSEMVTSGEGVCVLDPTAWPGLSVTGGGKLRVKGRVVVDSEGGGVDEDGNPVDNGNSRTAASCSNNSLLQATYIHVVGGVNRPENFQPYDPGDPSPLHCKQLRIPDPLLYLPTPTTATGVVDVQRGTPQATNTNLMLNDPSGENFLEPLPGGDQRMVLHPGIYTSIEITGGNVRLVPGIYVIKPEHNTENSLKITGGNVIASGIMFYATGHNYNPDTGNPDNTDGEKSPPPDDGAEFGGITINASIPLTGIDLEKYTYEEQFRPDEIFDGMLFYQRRRDPQALRVEGDAAEGCLDGTLYGKWCPVTISGQGIYDAQFVVGSMAVTGTADVTIQYAGKKLGKAPQIFLVE